METEDFAMEQYIDQLVQGIFGKEHTIDTALVLYKKRCEDFKKHIEKEIEYSKRDDREK